MTWLETTISHAPRDVAVALARRDEDVCRAVIAWHGDPDVVDAAAKEAFGRAAGVAQARRRVGHDFTKRRRELASNRHVAPEKLAELCVDKRPTVRLAAWANPMTPIDAVLEALGGCKDDEVFALQAATAHTQLAFRAAQVVVAHPQTAALLVSHPVGAVRSGAVSFGQFDGAHLTLTGRTEHTSGYRLNPTLPAISRHDRRRGALDELLAGKTCDEAAAAFDEHTARHAARIGAPQMDLALARTWPKVLLQEAYGLTGIGEERPSLHALNVAVACESDPDAWILAMGGQAVARVRIASALSVRLEAALAGYWWWSHGGRTPSARELNHGAISAQVAEMLSDNHLAWELWGGDLTSWTALEDVDGALVAARAALGATGRPGRP